MLSGALRVEQNSVHVDIDASRSRSGFAMLGAIRDEDQVHRYAAAAGR
jgi:hypothetical protein